MKTLILLLIPFLSEVESNNNPDAIGDHGKAVGVLQIHPVCVEDVNRITGKHYTLEDRRDRSKSVEMCSAYLMHYGTAYELRTGQKATPEVLARIWNGGPRGYSKASTLAYWVKVRRAMERGHAQHIAAQYLRE